jgi:hypothetical protein
LAHLLHLIRLRLRALWLQIQDLFDIRTSEDSMAPTLTFIEAEPTQNGTESIEGDVRVRRASQDLDEESFSCLLMSAIYEIRSADTKSAEQHDFLDMSGYKPLS